MKKQYQTPNAKVLKITINAQFLTMSGGTKGIGYGGLDTSATRDPASRRMDDWDWDDDEDY